MRVSLVDLCAIVAPHMIAIGAGRSAAANSGVTVAAGPSPVGVCWLAAGIDSARMRIEDRCPQWRDGVIAGTHVCVVLGLGWVGLGWRVCLWLCECVRRVECVECLGC